MENRHLPRTWASGMSQGGFCLWKHSTYRLIIGLGESPQPRALPCSHFNKYLIKMKDCFISSWKEQEALLFTPESEYFLFLEHLCRNPLAAACLELVWGKEMPGSLTGLSLHPSCHPSAAAGGVWAWKSPGRGAGGFLSCPVSLRTHRHPEEGQKPPTPKRGQKREPITPNRMSHINNG